MRKQNLSILIILILAFALLNKSFGLGLFDRFNPDLCANSISCIKDLSGKFEEGEFDGVFHADKVKTPSKIAQTPSRPVLGEADTNKRIEVDLTNQRAYAFEGGNKIFDFPISSGKWYPTPTGTFRIWIKLRYTKMSGGSKALGTYYYLPNVPYVMYFYNDRMAKSRGFGLHGTYWHNNFGHPMSHGCVNMRTEDVAQLYAWVQPSGGEKGTIYASSENPGTEIVIYGQTPRE